MSFAHKWFGLGILTVTLCAHPGCASVQVRSISMPDPVASSGVSEATWALVGNKWPTQNQMRVLLEDPETETKAGTLFATSELAYQTGFSLANENPGEALEWFLKSGRQTFLLLTRFDLSLEDFNRAQTIYNGSVAHCLRLAIKTKRFETKKELTREGEEGPLPVRLTGFIREADQFGPVKICQDLQVIGLSPVHREEGLGIPVLVEAIPPLEKTESTPTGAKQSRAPIISFPATALIHFDGPCHSPSRIELLNPLTIKTVSFQGKNLEVATDLTTPLAQTVSQSEFDKLAYLGFLRAQTAKDRSGVKMLEPYHPGKIPVVFVHGLASSPITWAPMFNDLLADSQIRQRYQFWVYFYPTGDPFPTSAADFREALLKLRKDHDPDGQDPAFDQMVLLGHSMGGLICKMMTVEGGDHFWPIVSQIPFEEVELSPKVRKELHRTFYFDRVQFVKRVVFIATPHHGSALSPSPLGRLAAKMVRLRDDLAEASREMVRNIPDLPGGHVPTSVELLAPDSLALKILATRTVPEHVLFHSIIGVVDPTEKWNFPLQGRPREPSDGVVTYKSAHLDWVKTELVVPADHMTVQKNDLSTREVKRILSEHLDMLESSMHTEAKRIRECLLRTGKYAEKSCGDPGIRPGNLPGSPIETQPARVP